MKRSDRRRFDKEFKKVLKTASDNCGLCGQAFSHNCKTFGGFTVKVDTVLAGECCRDKLGNVLAETLYITKNFDTVSHQSNGHLLHTTLESTDQVINSIQSHFSKLDEISNSLATRAGLQSSNHEIHLMDSMWKSDDANWFTNNPSRAHRLRPAYDGETDKLPKYITAAIVPKNHSLQIIVRQIEPGKRIRLPFWRNSEMEIPDEEEVIHALFDMASQSGKTGVIALEEVQVIADRYRNKSLRPN